MMFLKLLNLIILWPNNICWIKSYRHFYQHKKSCVISQGSNLTQVSTSYLLVHNSHRSIPAKFCCFFFCNRFKHIIINHLCYFTPLSPFLHLEQLSRGQCHCVRVTRKTLWNNSAKVNKGQCHCVRVMRKTLLNKFLVWNLIFWVSVDGCSGIFKSALCNSFF